MSFDMSRSSFDPRRDFLGVVMMQGRVQLDADWNEWAAQLVRRFHAGSLDTLGGNVVPRTTPDGFRIAAIGGGLTIGTGRIYVDGLLAENHGGAPNTWEPRLAEAQGTTTLNYTAQPYYPNPPQLPQAGPHLVYVDVWQRDVSALQVPGLIEKAVGVDTTGRRQTVWQVKVLADVGQVTCATPDDEIDAWKKLTAPSAARLSTATGVPNYEPDPCQVPPAAGYRGSENQLYRVEVHTGGKLGVASFKWSRDNATVASRVTRIDQARQILTVESLGRDDVLSFHDGDWVEVTDDWRELHNLPGELRRILVANGVDQRARTLKFELPLTAGLFPTDVHQATIAARNTRVRRWDQSGQVRREDGTAVQDLSAPNATGDIVIPAGNIRLFLEHGILVDFDLDPPGGEFKSGDHWLFTARSVDATVELLDRAPPLGIHHHYARLAVVNFPDDATDCRTLWPPVASGEGCECTVCVHPEGHNDGTATIQQAIDALKDVGGTICLQVGDYNLDTSLLVSNADSLRIQGQGSATNLIGNKPGTLLEIADSTGVTLQDLNLTGSATGTAVSAMLLAHNVRDLRVDRVGVVGLSGDKDISVAIGLAANIDRASIRDCTLTAERGIALVKAGETNHLFTVDLAVTRNLFLCNQRAVSFDGQCIHYGATCIRDNAMRTSTDAAIVATGMTMEGSPFEISDNIINTAGDGIHAGVSGVNIHSNTINGESNPGDSGNGIVILEGIDPVALDSARITANRVHNLPGNAIVITHRVEDAIIADNTLEDMGLAALLMHDGGEVGTLAFRGNRCHRLGAVSIDAFAAIQLLAVERGDICDNFIGHVARNATASPSVAGLRVSATGLLRVAGNHFSGIGPDQSTGRIAAIHILPPFGRTTIELNKIDRIGAASQKPELAEWRAIYIPRPPIIVDFKNVHIIKGLADIMYLLTPKKAYIFAEPKPTVSILNNQLRGHESAAPLAECASVNNILFSGNHCEKIGTPGKEPQLGLLTAHTLNASHNTLVASGEHDTLHLLPEIKRAIVVGNTSSGNIRVPVTNGETVPKDIALTNIIGVT